MIKIKNINGCPEEKPEGKFCGIHSDANSFYFFESEKEKKEFYDKQPVMEIQKPIHPLIELIKSCSAEEINQVKQLLK